MVKKIAATGVNVLLIQKSILKYATNDLSLYFLAKKGIMVVQDIERGNVEFISKNIGAIAIAHIDNITPDKFGQADLCEGSRLADKSKIFKITGVKNNKTVTVLLRGSNGFVLYEAERSLHGALCIIRSLIMCKALFAGGGAPEIEIVRQIGEYARTLK
jgi:T-complex protein 1 subunit delta